MCSAQGCSKNYFKGTSLFGRLHGGGAKLGVMSSKSEQLCLCKLCGAAGPCGSSWQSSTKQPCVCKLVGKALSAGGALYLSAETSSRFAVLSDVDICHIYFFVQSATAP